MASSTNNTPSLALRLRTLQMLSELGSRHNRAAPRALLAESLGVHERTVRRDIQVVNELRELCPPNLPFELPLLTTEQRDDGRAWVVLEQRGELGAAELFQYAAVYSAVSHLTALDDAVLGGSGLNALARLEAAGDTEIVETVQRAFYYRPFNPKDYDGDALDALEDVILAAVHRYTLRLTYRSLRAEAARQHDFEPWTLVLHRDGFYVMGRLTEHHDGRITLLSLSRIEHAEIDRSRTFEVPDDFDPADELGHSFGLWRSKDPAVDIELAFDAETCRSAAERRWPGFVEWRDRDDGQPGRLLHLHLPITPDLIVWILSWQHHVEVLSPPDLRDRLRETLRNTLALYE